MGRVSDFCSESVGRGIRAVQPLKVNSTRAVPDECSGAINIRAGNSLVDSSETAGAWPSGSWHQPSCAGCVLGAQQTYTLDPSELLRTAYLTRRSSRTKNPFLAYGFVAILIAVSDLQQLLRRQTIPGRAGSWCLPRGWCVFDVSNGLASPGAGCSGRAPSNGFASPPARCFT